MTIKNRCSTSRNPDCLYFILYRFIGYCVSCIRNKRPIVRVHFYKYLKDQNLFEIGKASTWMDKLYARHEEFILKTRDAVLNSQIGAVELERAIKEYVSKYLEVDMDLINKEQAVTVIDNSDFNYSMIKKPANGASVVTASTTESTGSNVSATCGNTGTVYDSSRGSAEDVSLEITVGSFEFRIKNKNEVSLFCDVVTMMRKGGLIK